MQGMNPTGTRASRAAAPRSARRIDDRVGVRHRDDGAEPAGRRGAGAGLEVLLVLLPGRAQVHVRVDERREEVLAAAVDALAVAVRLDAAGLAELGDDAAADEHVARRVDPGTRVEHVGARDDDVGRGAGAVDERRLAHACSASRFGVPVGALAASSSS
jgi:hypothetical protein